MEVIGAALRDHVDVDAEVGAVLGRVGAGLNFNFLNGFDHRPSRRRGDQIVHDADAV